MRTQSGEKHSSLRNVSQQSLVLTMATHYEEHEWKCTKPNCVA